MTGKKKKPELTVEQASKIADEVINAGALSAELSWNTIVNRMKSSSDKLAVKGDFHGQVEQIDNLLENDKTGIVNTILEFMVASATVPFRFVTSTKKTTQVLNNWAKNDLNKNVAIDIPVGLLELSGQYYRERLRSSFLILNIIWDEIDGYILPSRMFFSNGGACTIEKTGTKLNKRVYKINTKKLKDSETKNVIIRKPYNLWHNDYPTPYLVKKGVLYNSLLKNALVTKQGQILEEIIPYLLLLKAGDKDLMNKKMLGDLDKQLSLLKDSLKQAKQNQKSRAGSGDSILKGRYDVDVEHLIPELTKIFDANVVKPINNDILFGLGLVELQGFSSTRTEAILNPKVLIEEIIDCVKDLTFLWEDVVRLIVEKNKRRNSDLSKKAIRVIPGVIKPILTDGMKKLIKDFSNTGQLSIEDSFEALPLGFDFDISKTRRKQENKEGTEEIFFPRVILNQMSNDNADETPRENVTPQELPKE